MASPILQNLLDGFCRPDRLGAGGAPTEHPLLQRGEEVVGHDAEKADRDCADQHVAYAKPGARIVDQVAEAAVRGDEFRRDDDQETDGQRQAQISGSTAWNMT